VVLPGNGEKMKMTRTVQKLPLLLGLLIWFMAGPILANEDLEEVSTENALYVRGLVSKVYLDKMQISVRPPKGKSMRITIDPDTILEGVSQIDEFEKEQQVKIWYSPDEGNNRAIKIIKMMELGC
jgi:hypothetical protein